MIIFSFSIHSRIRPCSHGDKTFFVFKPSKKKIYKKNGTTMKTLRPNGSTKTAVVPMLGPLVTLWLPEKHWACTATAHGGKRLRWELYSKAYGVLFLRIQSFAIGDRGTANRILGFIKSVFSLLGLHHFTVACLLPLSQRCAYNINERQCHPLRKNARELVDKVAPLSSLETDSLDRLQCTETPAPCGGDTYSIKSLFATPGFILCRRGLGHGFGGSWESNWLNHMSLNSPNSLKSINNDSSSDWL